MEILRRRLGSNRPKKYAIEVDGKVADSFNLPDTYVSEYWDTAEGSVMFVIESEDDLRKTAVSLPGVRNVKRLRIGC